jgi:hypothetical protein
VPRERPPKHEVVPAPAGGKDGKALTPDADEPPVVARLVVEIRSDGSRTIARGAIEDAERGERVALKAEGATPLALALSLARAMVQIPSFARSAAHSLLSRPKK